MVPHWLFDRRFWYDCIFSTLGARLVGFHHNVFSYTKRNTYVDCVGDLIVLIRQMAVGAAFKTAIGMSLVSMISMELAMNITDVALTGGAMLTWWVIPFMLSAGFITPLPYNYWRLKALGKACH